MNGMSLKMKIPKDYRDVVEALYNIHINEAMTINGKKVQPIAQFIHPVAVCARSRSEGSFLIKKRKFRWDGVVIEL